MKKIIVSFVFLLISQVVIASEVTILHTSDIHGRIVPINYNLTSDLGGFARRVTFFKEVRLKNKDVVLLDSGDYFQGSLYYRVYKGKKSAELLKYAGYDAIALGNHEFDDGIDILKRNVKKSKTQFLSSNIKFNQTYLKNNIKPYLIKEIDGKKILIIGVTTSDLSNLSKTDKFEVRSASDSVKEIIQKIKSDKIIVVSHCGLEEDIEIAKNNPEINLILGGHNHLFFKTPLVVNNVPIIQDGEFGVAVGVIKFDTDKGFVSATRQNIDNSIKSDILVEEKIKKIDKKLNKLKMKTIAKTEVEIKGVQDYIEQNQSNLGILVLKSMIQPFKSYDAVFVQAGTIRINKNLTNTITYADTMEIVPFDGGIVKGKIQGKYLKSVLAKGKKSGRTYLQYHLNVQEINDDMFYTIITTDYIANGKDGYVEMNHLFDRKKKNTSLSSLLRVYLKKNPLITENTLKF